MGNTTFQLKAVLWKAWCSRRFHYISTACEIIFPILVTYLLIISNRTGTAPATESKRINQPISKNFILDNRSPSEVLFAPNSTEIYNFMMQRVKNKLNPEIVSLFEMTNESTMEEWFHKNSSSNLSLFYKRYGIVFNKYSNYELDYSIRSTESEVWRTNLRFPDFTQSGPMGETNVYMEYGFLALQIAIDESFMEFNGISPINWNLQKFPNPDNRRVDELSTMIQILFPYLLSFGYLFSLLILIKSVAEEKESGIRERLKLGGVKSVVSYAGWIIDSLIIILITSLAVAVLLNATWIKGAILQKSNYFILWFTIFTFYFSGTLFALAVSNICSKPKYSIGLGIFLWYGSLNLFQYVISKTPSTVTLSLLSLVPNGFLLCSTRAITYFESLGVGAEFSNIFYQGTHEGSTLPLGCCWIASWIGVFILFGITLYLDAILPGKYGVPKPWHFLFPKKCLSLCCRNTTFKNATIIAEEGNCGQGITLSANEHTHEAFLESTTGIKISHLSKRYGTVVSLRDFSVDIQKNQITALLGHNGAGKTTLLSIITGTLAPTSGDIWTDEYNVLHNMEEFRKDLGYCPQHDLLLPSLTVAEHIIFFGIVRGLSWKLAVDRSKKIMDKCNLTDKSSTRVAQLSGGMRRKLCLAISLINEPKILLLDEPTSGLDPESRRAIWDILLDLRKNRTVLFSTHFMEEADVLGDIIAIMSHGELKCYGTSLSLKKKYGSGYQVTVLLSPGTTMENVEQLVANVLSVIPEASILHQSVNNIDIQLPLNSAHHFATLFYKLENHKDLGVANLTVSCTTIDDVFKKVNEEDGVKFNVDEIDLPLLTSTIKNNLFFRKRCYAIWYKKMIWVYRNWIFAISYILLPFLIFIIYKCSNGSSRKEVLQPLELNLKCYGKTEVVAASEGSKYFKSFEDLVKKSGSDLVMTQPSNSLVNELLDFGSKDEARFRTSMIVAGNMSEVLPTMLYSSIGIHALPIAANLFSNTILNAANSSAFTIKTYNFPFIFREDSPPAASGIAEGISVTIILVIWVQYAISFLMVLAHVERTSLFKELQLLTGLHFHMYWLYTFIIDFVLYICVTLFIIISMLIFDFSTMTQHWNTTGYLVLVIVLNGLNGLWNSYIYSYFFKTYNGAISFFLIINFILCIAGIVIYNVLGYDEYKYLFFLNPLNPLAGALFKIVLKLEFYKTGADNPMIGIENDFSTELVYLGFDWLVYVGLVIVIEGGAFSFVWHYLKSLWIGSIPLESSLDADVVQEKDRVKTFINEKGGGENPVLIVNGIAKKYSRNVTAVKDVSFAALKGQCFGLLGTNGAGKSTTFQILTAYIRPTGGDVKLFKYSLTKHRNKYKKRIGYCPQSGGLLRDLTGAETLRIFAHLHGAPTKEIEPLIQKWLLLLGLKEYENRPTSTYSGGNLRKLSTAIALLGNPPVVFLDEPTTGVDPVTRRKIWQVLKMVQQNDQTIVLTSHSMDECEALCDHLTILVKGSMQCIGNIQYLKKKHGKGYTILIKLGTVSSDTLDALKERMSSVFSNSCKLKDEHQVLLHYHLEDPSYRWSTLFRNMDGIKAEFSAVEDYVLTGSSLEQVFLSFAAENESGLP